MTDVVRLGGLVVSEDAAAELVAALDQLDRLAAPRGMRLSNRLSGIRRELATCTSRADIPGHASNAAAYALDGPSFELSVVETATAAEQLGITADAVRWLCRRGQLIAVRTGGRWWVSVRSLEDYRARRAER